MNMRDRGYLGLILLCGFPGVSVATDIVPPDAQEVIDAVHSAATKRDFQALKDLMVQDFTWTFGYGGDRSSDDAIASWKTDPEALVALIRVTAGRCEPISEQDVQCPKDADISYRAGFTRTSSGWRLAYFVAGD